MSSKSFATVFRLLLPFALTAAVSLRAFPTSAQAVPVSINTTRIEIAGVPGEKVSSAFTFWNGTDEFLPIHIEANDFAPQDEEGHVTVGGAAPEGNSLKEWLEPELNDFAVAPQTKIDLRFTVNIPTTADPGTHYGALLVSTALVSEVSGAAIQVKIGPIILVKVFGDVKEQLTLEGFGVPRFAESPPITLEARFRNQGTVHEAPVGNIEVRNLLGTLVATGTLPARNVLPNAVRRVNTVVGEGFWLGRYAVWLRATYGDKNRELVSKQYVWVVPWHKLWPWALFGVVLVVLGFVARERFAAAWYALKTGQEPPSNF